MPEGGYNGLQVFVFTAGITVLNFAILYVATRYHSERLGQENFSRSYSQYFNNPKDPLETSPYRRRRPLGEELRIWDVWIASWYLLCRQPESPLERRGLGAVTLASALVQSFRGRLRPPC